ncbi:MAG TPA: hypothetical protein VFB96_24485 [Pirellulaceae bacterium]|nr:hypothetical protein [Pirellulaceae bacterium]
MIETTTILFVLAALGGLTLLGIRLSGVPRPPTWLALVHGAVAATALGMLIYLAILGIPLLSQIALGVFVLAALGGSFIFLTYHLRQRPLPIPLILGHGAAAITGVVLLIIDYFSRT